ncbi:hypothetical protein ABPG72_022314 [Tetrahymena utriculariae]
MRSYSQPQIQVSSPPFQIQPMYPPSQQQVNRQLGEWGQFFQQQEMKQLENYQQRKQYEQMRKQKYRELLDQDVQAKQNQKAIQRQEDINSQKYWNENEHVISDMLDKQKNAQKLYYQKLCEENLILAQQRQDQIYDQVKSYPQYQTMEERMNQFRFKEAQIYQNNQKKMEKEYQKIQQMNQQNQQLIEAQKITPLFPHQNIIRGSHNILNVERKFLHDKCDDVVYEQIKQKEAQKAMEREQKLRERELVEMQAKFLQNQEQQMKEQKKQQYQQYCTDNNVQSQFQKQLQVRENLMNARETALNSKMTKTRDKNGVELNPIYSLEYNSYERQKQLNQVDRALNRQITPNSNPNLSRIPTMNNLSQVNPLQVNNGQLSSTLVRNGSQLINRGQSPNSMESNMDLINNQPIQNQSQISQVPLNQSYIKKFQNHADNFSQIRTVNPQSLQNPQVNFYGAQLLHKNVQQESNFIKDSFGIHSNHGYNIISGHVFND